LEQQATGAMDRMLRWVVIGGVNPLVELLGRMVFSTPTPAQMPRLVGLWQSTRMIAVSLYVLFVLAAGLIVMMYQTVQTRYTLRELLPRLVVGFVLLNLSLWIIGMATDLANALSQALLGGGVDPASAAEAMRQTLNAVMLPGTSLWVIFVVAAMLVLIVALVIGAVVRVVLLANLLVAAPLALACHALPQTERLAGWWWRAFGALLAGQLGQALVLAVALRALFTPGGMPTLPTFNTGQVASDPLAPVLNLFLLLGVVGIMVNLPFWMLSAAKLGQGRSLLGNLIRTYAAYKTLGLVKAKIGTRAAAPGATGRRGGGPGPGPAGPAGRRPGGGPPGGPLPGPGGPGPGTGPGGPGPRPNQPRNHRGSGATRTRTRQRVRTSTRTSARRGPGTERNTDRRTQATMPTAAPVRGTGTRNRAQSPTGAARGTSSGAPSAAADLRAGMRPVRAQRRAAAPGADGRSAAAERTSVPRAPVRDRPVVRPGANRPGQVGGLAVGTHPWRHVPEPSSRARRFHPNSPAPSPVTSRQVPSRGRGGAAGTPPAGPRPRRREPRG
jgi:hypothetical protein